MKNNFFLKGFLLLSLVTGLFAVSPCSKGTWECQKVQECIEGSRVCDGRPDCTDNTDEIMCKDKSQNDLWNNLFRKRPEADREKLAKDCDFDMIPAKCQCKESTRIYCINAGFDAIPSGIPVKTTLLHISANKLKSIPAGIFSNFTKLTELSLMHNSISTVDAYALDGCLRLKKLYLGDNEIHSIDTNFIPKDNSLEELNLDYNLLKSLDGSAFRHLLNLKVLFLQHNKISTINPGTFMCMEKLSILFLTGNQLSVVRRNTFSNLTNVLHLHLGDNRLYEIEDYSFSGLKSLNSLGLSNNIIRSLRSYTFIGLGNLTFLDLRKNSIVTIAKDAFQALKKLKSLDLRENLVRSIPVLTLSVLSDLENIYFDEFYMCAFAPFVPHCEPFGDGISSRLNLLENIFLRIMVWIVAIVSCCGNFIVILGRFLLRDDNQIHSFYIKNLSAADLLMGIYLLIIGSRDQMYRGEYLRHDQEWRQSTECDLCGVLCTLSSEISVLTLTLITLDRFISIIFPIHSRKKSSTKAYTVMACIWLVSIFITIIPITGLPYFGNSFYRDNSVCIPLHLHNPKARGWEYSSFLFLGVNCVAFSFICYAYIAMFISVKRTTTAVRSHFQNQERRLAKRFFFIVMTDFMCWAPVMAIKAAALTGIHIEGNLYAWLVIFIMPVNSAINPLLYTLTTKLFKDKVLPKFCCGYTLTRRQYIIRETYSSSSSDRRNRLASLRNKYEKDMLFEAAVQTMKCGSPTYSNKRSDQHESVQLDEIRQTGVSRNYLCFKTRNSFRCNTSSDVVNDSRGEEAASRFLSSGNSSSF